MKGFIYAAVTVLLWSMLNVVNRYFVVRYNIDIIVFTVEMICATGVALLIIGKPQPQDIRRVSLHYSWLYTIMQIFRSFFMITSFLYITTTETSLLFNIETVVTFVFVWAIFRRRPHISDYIGSAVILLGFVLFILYLPRAIETKVTLIVLGAAVASCIRSIVVEKTTMHNPNISVRQKCGVSGETMFFGGAFLTVCLIVVAFIKYGFGNEIKILNYMPSLEAIVYPPTVIGACIAGFILKSTTTWFYYATLKLSHSETFMAVRSFQPIVTYVLETLMVVYYAGIRPDLSWEDWGLGGVMILGALLILVVPHKERKSQEFIAD